MKKSSSLPSGQDDSTIVRVTGHGQFTVNKSTMDKINDIDNQIVDILKKDNNIDEKEFRKKITEMVNLITTEGNTIDDRELVASDIIVPDADLSIDEAKNIFRDEGIIPDMV
jgi:PspAA-like protein